MKYGLLVLLSLATASIAHAVPYELPMDSGWYQLQDSKTYETLCSTGSGLPCDVPPGEYVLINHNAAVGQPDRRVIVQVGVQAARPTIGYEDKICEANTYFDSNNGTDPFIQSPLTLIGCTVQCTTGMVTGGSCLAHYTGFADASEFTLNTKTQLSDEGFRCSLTSFPGAEPYSDRGGFLPARFYIGLACLQ